MQTSKEETLQDNWFHIISENVSEVKKYWVIHLTENPIVNGNPDVFRVG